MSSSKSKSSRSGKGKSRRRSTSKAFGSKKKQNALKNGWNECASVKSMIVHPRILVIGSSIWGSSNQGIWKYDIVSDTITLIAHFCHWSNTKLKSKICKV